MNACLNLLGSACSCSKSDEGSKERLRRSRTESSGAAPAIEELPGIARQVRPEGPQAEKLATGFGFLAGGEVWRAPGPPAPPGIKPLRKFEYPPLPRPRPAEVGISRPGTDFSHSRRGLEGARPSSSPEHQILEEVQISIFAPRPAEVGISRFGFALAHPKRSGGRPALQHPRASNPCGSSNIHLRPDRVPQKSEVADRAVLLPCEEVWRASGPPAPASIKSLRKFNLPPPSRVLFLLRIVENLQSTVKML